MRIAFRPLQGLFRAALPAAMLGAVALVAPAHAQQAAPDRKAIESIIKDYLVKNPEVIQEALIELERRQKDEEEKMVKRITSDPKSPLYVSEHHTVFGNPNGSVTLVEFFDFNCGFCKRGLANIQKIIETDKDVRVVMKEFPVLSQGSKDAAVVALALREQFDTAKLWKFHASLLGQRGGVGTEQALALAKELGADIKKLQADMASRKIEEALQETRVIADALKITGTPSYVVAEDLVIGDRGYDALASRIAAYKKCKKASC